MIKPHPGIMVTPTKGVIPGQGSIDINVTFSPTVKATATA
jgi:hypothetical protein